MQVCAFKCVERGREKRETQMELLERVYLCPLSTSGSGYSPADLCVAGASIALLGETGITNERGEGW